MTDAVTLGIVAGSCMAMESVRCTEFVALATELMERALPEEVEASLLEHADGCDGCRVYLWQLQKPRFATSRA